MTPQGLARRLDRWRDELREALRHDPGQYLGRRYHKLADSVPRTFPTTEILNMYLNPLTSWSNNQDGGSEIPAISLGVPDIRALSAFCRLRFGWSPEYVHQSLKEHVWQGAFLRMVCKVGASHFSERKSRSSHLLLYRPTRSLQTMPPTLNFPCQPPPLQTMSLVGPSQCSAPATQDTGCPSKVFHWSN